MSLRPTDIPEIAALSIPEKIQFLEDLWDSIPNTYAPPPSAELRQLLMDRLRYHEADPTDVLSLEDLMHRVAERRK